MNTSLEEKIALPDTYATFDGIKYILQKQGYNIVKDEKIVCENCGWSWMTSQSDEHDKYVCHKCGHDNEQKYIMSKFKEPKSISEIADIHGVQISELQSQLLKGIKAETEHTTDEKIAEIIALHHLEEIPNYYDLLENMEKTAPTMENEESEFNEGGVVVGKRHSESDENGTGERFTVKSTGQIVEVEGGEGVLCKESMSSDTTFLFEGKKQTAREIASFLNHKYGGVEFAKGGTVKADHVCGCNAIRFLHGGELPSATLEGLEGGEAVVTVKTMESNDRYMFEGRKMTPRQTLSIINAKFGGKKFEEGGTIDLSKHRFDKEVKMTKMVYFVQNVLYLS